MWPKPWPHNHGAPSGGCHGAKHEVLQMPFRLQVGLDIEKCCGGQNCILKVLAHKFGFSEETIKQLGKQYEGDSEILAIDPRVLIGAMRCI